jgi:hypothetical protein
LRKQLEAGLERRTQSTRGTRDPDQVHPAERTAVNTEQHSLSSFATVKSASAEFFDPGDKLRIKARDFGAFTDSTAISR